MAVTIDPRPSYFGDRMVVTGSYGAGDLSIALGDMLASIDMAVVTPISPMDPTNLETGGAADASDVDGFGFAEFATVAANGTTITVNTVQAGQALVGGRFIAIGRRS
tara:strand:+ start:1090 stop:1410 length:321 start_codon:yes stop_codon:yes gene_type:complete